MKRQIEIEDDLQERIDSVKEEIKDNFIDYLKENKDITDFDEYYQAQGCNIVHEIADSNTPIYYSDIDGLHYLYGDEFDEAYENAGIGYETEDNYKQAAIYCYLSEKGFDYLRELEDKFEEMKLNEESIDNLIKQLV